MLKFPVVSSTLQSEVLWQDIPCPVNETGADD